MKCLECDLPEIQIGNNITKHHAETGHTQYQDIAGKLITYPVDNDKAKLLREPKQDLQKDLNIANGAFEQMERERDKALIELDQVRTELNTLKPLFNESQEIAKDYRTTVINLRTELQNVTASKPTVKTES